MAANLLYTFLLLIFRSVVYFTDFANVWQDTPLRSKPVQTMYFVVVFFSLRIELLHFFGGIFLFLYTESILFNEL